MAKSNLDKLKDTIATCIELISQASVGDEPRQYPISSKESFQVVIQEAEALVESEGIEPSQFETENSKLNEAKEIFVSSLNVELPKEDKPELVDLMLIGTPSQCKGSHSLHFSGGIVTFTDGKSVVPAELGAEIIKSWLCKMSKYLEIGDTDYVPTGVKLTEPLIIRASAIIDGRCKREIGVKTYTERIPLTDSQRGHLSYFPVLDLLSAKGRPTQGAFGNFFGPPEFESIDNLNIIDVDKEIGSVWCGHSPFGTPYKELEASYTSGWETTPEKIKVACGLIIGQIATNPNFNVKSKKDFDFSIEYFGNSMITPEIADLLSEFELRSFR